MKKILLTLPLLCLVTLLWAQGGKARIAFAEHSIRWMNESNFPYYLKLQEVDNQIKAGIEEGLSKKFGYTLSGDYEIKYRVIDLFGKAKAKTPQASGSGPSVTILSAMTRGTTDMSIQWKMEVSVKDGSSTLFSRASEHEIQPVSVSGYLTKQRWMTAEEFTTIFLQLLNEALELTPPVERVISVGSYEEIAGRVAQVLPFDKQYRLQIGGGMMQEVSSAYVLKQDTTEILRYRYKEGAEITRIRQGFFSTIMSEIFSSITGLDVEYRMKSKIEKRGTLINEKGNKTKIRVIWLEESTRTGIGQVQGRFVSPIMGELYDGDNVFASFIYYKELNTNNEQLTKKNFRLTGTKGTLGVSDTHVLKGKLEGHDFELMYPEQEGMVAIWYDGNPTAVLTMFNENPKSRSFAGVTLSQNKKTAIGKSSLAKADPDRENAEHYSLYTNVNLTPEVADKPIQLLIMMFFSIAQTLESDVESER